MVFFNDHRSKGRCGQLVRFGCLVFTLLLAACRGSDSGADSAANSVGNALNDDAGNSLVQLPSSQPARTPEPFSLFADPSGINRNAAATVDVADNLNAILEYDRLIDADGTTACDRYFGWGGEPRVNTEAQKLLCGKYQFLYEHWSTVGVPQAFVEFNEQWFPEYFGEQFHKLGFLPHHHFRRVVTDVRPLAAGEAGSRQQCNADFTSCETVPGPVAEEDTWQEIYHIVAADPMPAGFQRGPRRTFGFEASSFTCASCHMGRLPDGRYAVGMANQHLNYGQFLVGFIYPFQASITAWSGTRDPGFYDLTNFIKSTIPEAEPLIGLMSGDIHPAMMFSNPSTEHEHFGPGMEAMINDLKTGTCYSNDRGELLRCDHNRADRGPQQQQRLADEMMALLTKQFGSVTTSEWTMAVKEVFGDAYCLPEPLTPSMVGGSDSAPWGQFQFSLDPRETFASMEENCEGRRWDTNYWQAFFEVALELSNADLLDFSFSSMSDQDLLINAGFNVLDFLLAPMSDDLVWTLSKIANVVGISPFEVLEEYPEMRTAGGRYNQMLALSGAGRDLTQFVSAFILLSASVDPRYLECDNPDIVRNWDASPDESCRVKTRYVEPLVAYIESLRTPYPINTSHPSPGQINRGRRIFADHCAACHDGPTGESSGIFVFGASEALKALPLCAPDQRTVEWTDDLPPQPLYNHCFPVYSQVVPGASAEEDIARYIGKIATDPTYSQFAQPDPETGLAGVNPELATLGKLSQGVKAQRLTGVRYKSELLHHGQLKTLDELLCRAGTRRETVDQRRQLACMGYDLETSEGIDAYKAGNGEGICLRTWRPLDGHEFGCDLGEADKTSLIEYLESL